MLTRVQAFEALRRNLEITELQEKTVADRQNKVRAAVERQLTVTDSFLTGSYRRKTMISPLKDADVDVVLVLDRAYRERGPRAVLNMVRDALLDEYPRTPKISRNGQAVTVTFSDFTVDVVPGFVFPWWDLREGWQICDSGNDTWISTNPKTDEARSARGNQIHGGNLVPWIKELKAWNRTAGEPLRSFHLETLAWSVFGTSRWWYASVKTDWDACRHFFKKAPARLRPYPPGYASLSGVGAYLTSQALDRLISKVEGARDRCRRADVAARNGDLEAMHEEYHKIFGDWYPRSCA